MLLHKTQLQRSLTSGLQAPPGCCSFTPTIPGGLKNDASSCALVNESDCSLRPEDGMERDTSMAFESLRGREGAMHFSEDVSRRTRGMRGGVLILRDEDVVLFIVCNTVCLGERSDVASRLLIGDLVVVGANGSGENCF